MSRERSVTGTSIKHEVEVASDLRREFPLLYEMANRYDDAERLGGSAAPILAEADAALRELWMARTNNLGDRRAR